MPLEELPAEQRTCDHCMEQCAKRTEAFAWRGCKFFREFWQERLTRAEKRIDYLEDELSECECCDRSLIVSSDEAAAMERDDPDTACPAGAVKPLVCMSCWNGIVERMLTAEREQNEWREHAVLEQSAREVSERERDEARKRVAELEDKNKNLCDYEEAYRLADNRAAVLGLEKAELETKLAVLGRRIYPTSGVEIAELPMFATSCREPAQDEARVILAALDKAWSDSDGTCWEALSGQLCEIVRRARIVLKGGA